MTQPFVVLATPTFGDRPCKEYSGSLAQSLCMLSEAGIGFALIMQPGDPYLPKVRNRLVAQFLNQYPQATDLLFLDDDIGWDPIKVVEFVRRPQDIVVGAYPKKKDALEFPVTLALAADGEPIEQDGLFMCHLAPTGFMRIKRHVLEKMAMVSARYEAPDGSVGPQWNIFEARYVDPALEALRKADLSTMSRDDAIAYLRRAIGVTVSPDIGGWWGEDFWFVERWREMGGAVWVDPDIRFTHRGTKAWEASFGDTLRPALANRKETAT